MASIINASSSGSGGIVQTADASGVLQLQSNGTVAVNILSGTSIAVGSATAYNGGGFGSNVSIYGSTAAAITVVNATEQFQMGANSANNLGFYNPTHATYMAAMNQYGIGVGSAVPSSGSGVTFPATQSASSDANTLDDYEEGTCNLTLWDGTTQSPSQVCYYRKIGGYCWITIDMYSTDISALNTAHLRIANLPFNPTATANAAIVATVSGNTPVLCQPITAQNYAYLYTATSGSINISALTKSQFSSSSSCSLWGQFGYTCT